MYCVLIHKPDNKITPFGWCLLVVPISSFALGCWQVKRRRWKEDLIADLKARTTLKPIPLPDDISYLTNMEYHPVIVRGHYVPEKSVLMGPRSLIVDGDSSKGGLLSQGGKHSGTGFHVITPFKLLDRDGTIMVNRGWIPANKRKVIQNDAEKESSQNNEPVTLIGVVRHTEDRSVFAPRQQSGGTLLYRNVPYIAELTGSTLPVFLDVRESSDQILYDPDKPIPNQTRVTLRNEHTSYIFTWFGLSAFTGYMWYTSVFKKIRLP
ncbi:SURF1-like protein [Ctenocephalides felis]|uniref:SURF1-like protein n=1 Tax=Ctenocephalides felis TaxID=7515 RepID=UPI000E6E41BA|nr:SURF1-like protein [Ctenocephalides felis]